MKPFELSEPYKVVCTLSGCGELPCLFAGSTFYYDESGNAHRIVVKDGKDINLKREDRIFVLGGILAKQGISLAELRMALGKTSGAEIKSTKLLKGDFCQVLRKENVHKILKLILNRKWRVHYHMVQPLYYAYVDVIDSIGFDAENHIELKDVFYHALEDKFDQSLALFKKSKYPRIKESDRDIFLKGLLEIVHDYAQRHGESRWTRMLSEKLEAGVGNEGLPFLEGPDLTPHSWIDSYVHFYHTPLYSWPNNDHVFDCEKTIEKALSTTNFTFNGKPWKRWRMVDSDDEPMVQVSDCVVSILRKYYLFLEKPKDDIIHAVEGFDQFQMANFKLLNYILALSSCANKRIHAQICCQSLSEKMRWLVRVYVPSNDAEYDAIMKCSPTGREVSGSGLICVQRMQIESKPS